MLQYILIYQLYCYSSKLIETIAFITWAFEIYALHQLPLWDLFAHLVSPVICYANVRK